MNAETKIEKTLHSAMAAAFAEIEAATKAADNPAFKRDGKALKYADLTAVIGALKPALIAHGLFFTQRCQPAEDGVSVETVLHHASGEKESLGTLYVPANKRDAQGFGSALTYARRYALVTAFGVPVEDDDGNAAAASAPKNGAAKTPKVAAITDAQRDMIQTLAAAAGVPIQNITKAYKVDSLLDLTAEEGDAACETLRRQMSAKKEPVNA